MRQLVARDATVDQVRKFVSSFSATNYFVSCSTKIIPEGSAGLFTVRVTPIMGNLSVAAFMHKELINPESGYTEGGLVFAIEEVPKE